MTYLYLSKKCISSLTKTMKIKNKKNKNNKNGTKRRDSVHRNNHSNEDIK